ncbi:hypothetical protein AVEN_186242-1 [Araneus ventricosus]|uniref:Uncharacterized protein n=1 Tax=Araneus ventricosus TaxID=182803 RepID=A0A4Y2L086_ARAVE|nr:hypothetical protein AVEN_186242-1 [Araneus ventricosus]
MRRRTVNKKHGCSCIIKSHLKLCVAPAESLNGEEKILNFLNAFSSLHCTASALGCSINSFNRASLAVISHGACAMGDVVDDVMIDGPADVMTSSG